MFKKALEILNELDAQKEDDSKVIMYLLITFLEENYKVCLTFSNIENIKEQDDFKHYQNVCYDVVTSVSTWLGHYIDLMMIDLQYGFDEDEAMEKWEEICLQSSMLEFLYEVGEGSGLEFIMDIWKAVDLKNELIRVGTIIIKENKALDIPNGIPKNHWWWKIPILPTDDDCYEIEHILMFTYYKKLF